MLWKTQDRITHQMVTFLNISVLSVASYQLGCVKSSDTTSRSWKYLKKPRNCFKDVENFHHMFLRFGPLCHVHKGSKLGSSSELGTRTRTTSDYNL